MYRIPKASSSCEWESQSNLRGTSVAEDTSAHYLPRTLSQGGTLELTLASVITDELASKKPANLNHLISEHRRTYLLVLTSQELLALQINSISKILTVSHA